MSQRKLAPRCGVDRSTIQKIEARKLVPSVELARRIEAELGCEPGVIFGQPRECGCGCGGLTFTGWLPGHNPGAVGRPVTARADRPSRSREGDRLRAARIARGLTQAELGRLVGVSGFTIAAIENGKDLPSERVTVALREALNVSDLFELKPCPCGCGKRTVGGRYARGHRPLTDVDREKVSAGRREWWASEDSSGWRETLSQTWQEDWRSGGPRARALFEAAKEGRTPIQPTGRTRQVYLGRWAPKGGRAAGWTQEQANAIIALKRAHPGWGRTTLARRTGLSERQIRYILEQAGQNPS
jgi:transcriptional regulator with XRE-family HTH domain